MVRKTSGKDTNTHSDKLRHWNKGDLLSAKHFDEPVRILRKVGLGVTPARQVRRKAGGNFFCQRMEIVSVSEDYLICKLTGDENKNDEIRVAKPPEFRKIVFDKDLTGPDEVSDRALPNGLTVEYEYLNVQKRKAIDTTDSDNTEIQVIVPAYVENDIIFAMAGITGGTGVTELVAGLKEDVPWQDMNVSGRAWAKADDQDDET